MYLYVVNVPRQDYIYNHKSKVYGFTAVGVDAHVKELSCLPCNAQLHVKQTSNSFVGSLSCQALFSGIKAEGRVRPVTKSQDPDIRPMTQERVTVQVKVKRVDSSVILQSFDCYSDMRSLQVSMSVNKVCIDEW